MKVEPELRKLQTEIKPETPALAYFFLGKPPVGLPQTYQHCAVVFAEGLIEMGWRIVSDTKFWQVSPSGPYLFPGGADGMVEEASLIVFGEDYFVNQGSEAVPPICKIIKCPKVYIERNDLTPAVRWIYNASLRGFDLILKCHASTGFRYPDNVKPTVFGISRRISESCQTKPTVQRHTAEWAFDHKKYPHTVRTWADREVRPAVASQLRINSSLSQVVEEETGYAELMRKQTNGRHYTSYYERLQSSIICACFGGWFLLPFRQLEGGMMSLLGRKLFTLIPSPTALVAQWDSWRLWEAFASGTAVLHLNFEKHGFLTGGPTPEPMKHYIPVNLRNPAKELLPVLNDPEHLLKVGLAGRQWAMENFGPKPIAARTLNRLGLA